MDDGASLDGEPGVRVDVELCEEKRGLDQEEAGVEKARDVWDGADDGVEPFEREG